MTDDERHEPENRRATDEWNDPQLEDLDTDDPSEGDDRFLLSASEFPSENVTDLK